MNEVLVDQLERFEPGLKGQIAYEHLHRYAICRECVSGARVLDLGSGEGYGTGLLGERASYVTGLDVDADSVAAAQARHGVDGRVIFKVGSAHDLPFPDASFDVVVSFEMIEHVDRQERVIAEVRRVLKPGGLFVVSTPSREVYNQFKAPNEFHVKELDQGEFAELLGAEFAHVEMLGERIGVVSMLAPLDRPDAASDYAGYIARYGESDSVSIEAAAGQFTDPEYLVAFCSDTPIRQRVFAHSIMIAPQDDLWTENTKVRVWASGLHEEDEALRKHVREVEAEKADLVAEKAALTARIKAEAVRLSEEAELSALRARIANDRRLASIAVRSLLLAAAPPVRKDGRRFRRPIWRSMERLGLFHAEWYAARTPGIAPRDALAHFRSHGLSEGRDPHPFFHSAWFALQYPQENEGAGPLSSYIRAKTRGALSPHPFFDPHHYARLNPDVAAANVDALSHFLSSGEREGRPVHPLIDLERLRSQGANPGAGASVLWAYATDPALFDLSPHPLFDAKFYLSENPAVRDAGIHPLVHYLVWGWREGRSPHPYFDNDWYLSRYPDVLAERINPLVHYVTTGADEGRDPNPLFSTMLYLEAFPKAQAPGITALEHFLRNGGRNSSGKAFTLTAQADVVSVCGIFTRAGRTPLDLLSVVYEPVHPDDDVTDDGEDGVAWPPAVVRGYAMGQGVNDYLVRTERLEQQLLYSYLFAVIARQQRSRRPFTETADFRRLQKRAVELSQSRAARFDTKPDVSVLVPVYNNLLDTLVCIVSLLEQDCGLNYEIIVADDCSTDGTEVAISAIGGVVREVRHSVNLGFLGNCNAAAQTASGDVLVLLNNDTVILSGWLEGLVDALRADPRVGMAGSKLLNWNGTLQEAGGIFWRDGSAWNFGRNADALQPEFNYLKEVDFCSGASIALPMTVWRELNGFDPLYKPAYCEDADLAFRVRQSGRKVIYQPRSELIHHEGRSHGRDISVGIKAYQVRNMAKLFERWKSVLEADHFANGEHVFTARDRSGRKPHIVIIDHYVPQWDRDAGSRSVYHYIRLLLDRGFHVTFWPDNMHYDPQYVPHLQEMGVEVIYGMEYLDRFKPWMDMAGEDLDYILLSRPHISMKYIDDIKASFKGKVLYYGIDLHYKRMELEYKVTGDPKLLQDIAEVKNQELTLCRTVDLYMYPSQDEIDVIRAEIGPEHAGIAIPLNIFSDDEIIPFDAAALARRDPFKLMFVGGFRHLPNVDAVKWFIADVLPLIRQADPRYHLVVVGSYPPDDVCSAVCDGVTLLGRISDEDLLRLYGEVGASVAPLRYGGGMKGKVIEALARATPLVTTSVGVQGIPNATAFIAVTDTAEAFAQAVLDTTRNPEATAQRVRDGVAFIQAEYSYRTLGDRLSHVIPELAPERRS